MDDNNATVEQGARHWLNENADIWLCWMTEETATRVHVALDAGPVAEGWPDICT